MTRNRNRTLDFEGIIQDGENPLGFTSQSAPGTGHWKGTGWNKTPDYTSPQLPPDRTRPAGRNNRTAEQVIVQLLEIPRTPAQWEVWAFANLDSHRRIIEKIAANGGPSLPEYYAIYPLDLSRPVDFLQANAQMHIDMDNYLGVQGVDLQDVDFRNESQLVAWINLHWLEHQTAETRLGL